MWRWLLVALAVLQVGRLALFMAVPSFTVGAAVPTTGVRHACLAAYLRGAELAADDPARLYRPEAYRGGNASRVPGLAPHLSDPWQYPPTALILPALLLATGADWDAMRLVWFVAQGLAFSAIAVAVARTTRERWLLLAVAASFPVLMNFQWGQMHLMTLALGVLAWHLVGRGREVTGGLALSAAIGMKLFPGILVVPLLVARRWRALAWTALFGAAQVAIVVAWFGTEPMVAFVRDHLASLASGRAFAVFADEPSFTSANLSIGGLGLALGMTLPGLVGLLYAAAMAGVAGWRVAHGGLDTHGALALLVAGSFASTYVPAAYGMAGVIWLVSMRATRLWGVAWVFLAIQPFAFSFPVLWRMPVVLAALAVVSVLLSLVAVGQMTSAGHGDGRSRSHPG